MLDDFETAPIDDKLRAMLRFLKKLNSAPSEITKQDARALREAGISRQASSDAIHVLYLFSIYTRLADSMGWEVPDDPAYYAGAATRLLTRGYG